MFEAQAAWITDLVSGVASLPDVDRMTGEVDAHLARVARRHGTTAADSLQVDVGKYLRALRRARDGRRADGRSAPWRTTPFRAVRSLDGDVVRGLWRQADAP
ncbi:hypothetical protein AB0G02_38665 [Actinosynnema sp. NPDC023658]|uniref:hypothetical protein n=1 Tax=Actinosynnema sp. NPDC023658 TaxID=3155465 RepID=UPI00340B497D